MEKAFKIVNKDNVKLDWLKSNKEHESLLHQAINSFISEIQTKKEELIKEIIKCVFAIDNHYLFGFSKKHISCVSYEEKPNQQHYFYNFGLEDEKLLAIIFEPEISIPNADAQNISYEFKYWSCLDNE